MKKAIIAIIFIVTVVAYYNFIFVSYNNKITEQELYKQVEQIFHERTRIWNSFLIGQYTSLSQLEKELKTIVTNPLFKTDMKIFKQMLSVPTSYEGISSVSIQNIRIIKNNFDKVILEVLILWEVAGYEDNYNEEIKYIIDMKKHKEKWLLSDYKIVNNKCI